MGVKVAFLSEEPSRKKAKTQDQVPAAKVVIPKSAVHGEGSDTYVFAVRDGKLERRAVSLGRGIAGDVEIMAGANAGDELVVRGPENLQDGERVEIRQ
jgi:membrane fusion protein (multidrug efflux system)